MNELYHYGIPRRSGRYPYGSGDRPYQSEGGRVNTDTLRIRSLDRKIERAKHQNRKNIDRVSLERRRDRLVNRDSYTRSDDPYLRKIAKVQRAKDNAHVYRKIRTNTKILGEIGIIGIEAALGNLGGVVLSAGYIGVDLVTKKIYDRAIDKVGNKTIRNISSKYTKEYEDNVLRSLKTNPEEAKRLVREQTEKQYRILGYDSYFIGKHGWDKKTAEEAFQDLVDEVTKDKMELLSGKTDDEIRKEKYLRHSAKGSVWENHKYVKKIDGVYYYPVGYEDGRTIDELSDRKKKDDSSKESNESIDKQIDQVKHHFDEYLKERGIDWRTLPKDEVDEMQRHIVSLLEGKKKGTESSSGDKSDAKKLAEELMNAKKESSSESKSSKSSSSKKESSEKKEADDKKKAEEEKKKKKTAQSSSSSSNKKKVDMNKVWAVYHNKDSIEIKREK